jgi:PhoPQ-activated pathogenicity-related protein
MSFSLQMSGFGSSILYVDGDDNSVNPPSDIDPLTEILCVSSGLVTGHLGQIPNQPIVFPSDPLKKRRVEDAIIAFTWAHFLNDTSNPYWLLRLPMTKAVVRAMDTIQAFTSNLPNVPKITSFGVAGASKRGWTTWTTAAVDMRVKFFIPIVIPVLDMVSSINRLYQPYGEWSFALTDYLDAGVIKYLNEPVMQQLANIVDPFVYNSRYANRPHYLVCAAGDEFFLPDSANGFYSALTGPKYLRIVPDAEHSLIGQQFDVALSVDTFIQMWLHNEPVRRGTPS